VSRRPRIDLAGWHHVINRGVARSDVFGDKDDYAKFLEIVCKAASSYRAQLHDYALMPNHYHLLIQTELENLSGLMKQINSNYAIYFNKKYQRSGHLWQGRFTSRYVTNEAYLYSLMRYIENNPVHASLSEHPGEYPHTLIGAMRRGAGALPTCARRSLLVEQIGYAGISEWIGVELSDEDYRIIETIARQKSIETPEGKRLPAHRKSLEEHLGGWSDRTERNQHIVAALADGYTQAETAHFLGLTRASISIIVKKLTFNA